MLEKMEKTPGNSKEIGVSDLKKAKSDDSDYS
jgi:hypothetical protein